jgi:hypothetical protein
MFGPRRPWVTTLLALVLGVAGFGLMFMTDATGDFSGWLLVIAAVQLPWLWIIDLRDRTRDADPASQRMSLAARITASLSIALAGGVISAGPFYAVFDAAESAGIRLGESAILSVAGLTLLPMLSLVWGWRAWLVSKRQAPRRAVRSMLAALTLFSVPAVGVCWLAHAIARDGNGLLPGLLSGLALVGALMVLAWTTVPWLELYLSGRRRNAAPTM